MFEAFDIVGMTIGTYETIREFVEDFIYTECDHENFLNEKEYECEREGRDFDPSNYSYEDGVDFYCSCIRQNYEPVLTPDGIPAIEWDGFTLVGISSIVEE